MDDFDKCSRDLLYNRWFNQALKAPHILVLTRRLGDTLAIGDGIEAHVGITGEFTL